MGCQLGTLFENETLNSDNGPCAIFDIKPFASGRRLLAFRGIKTQVPPEDQLIKVFRTNTGDGYESSNMRSRSYVQAKVIAVSYLTKYGGQSIQFLEISSAEMDRISVFTRHIHSSDNRQKRRLSENDVVVFERNLGNNFQTFVERDGTVNSSCSALLQEFVHFVYNISRGREIITGLKGTHSSTRQVFKLTSPSVHSVGKTYGPDDIGEGAMVNFFASHKCTRVCSQWPKPVVQNPFKCSENLNGSYNSLKSCQMSRSCILSSESGVGGIQDTQDSNTDLPPPYDSQWLLQRPPIYSREEPSAPPLYDINT